MDTQSEIDQGIIAPNSKCGRPKQTRDMRPFNEQPRTKRGAKVLRIKEKGWSEGKGNQANRCKLSQSNRSSTKSTSCCSTCTSAYISEYTWVSDLVSPYQVDKGKIDWSCDEPSKHLNNNYMVIVVAQFQSLSNKANIYEPTPTSFIWTLWLYNQCHTIYSCKYISMVADEMIRHLNMHIFWNECPFGYSSYKAQIWGWLRSYLDPALTSIAGRALGY